MTMTSTATTPSATLIPWELSMLSTSDRISYSHAIQQGFVIWTGHQQRLRDAYHSWCELHQRPFVSMQVDGGQANVCIDLAPLQRQFDQQGESFTRYVEALEQALCQYVAGYDQQERWRPGTYTMIEEISISHAPALSRAFLDAYTHHLTDIT